MYIYVSISMSVYVYILREICIQEPRAKIQGTRAKSPDPRPKTQGPRPKTHEPRAKSQEPSSKSQEPRPKGQEPRSKSQDPRPQSLPSITIYFDFLFFILPIPITSHLFSQTVHFASAKCRGGKEFEEPRAFSKCFSDVFSSAFY